MTIYKVKPTKQNVHPINKSRSLLPDANSKKALALSIARLGFRVLPTYPNRKKKPIYSAPFTHGYKSATTDHMAINFAWRIEPDANPAIATGHGKNINLVVVDCDSPEALKKLQALYGKFPPTYCVRRGDHTHHYFRAPDDVTINRHQGFIEKTDIIGEGSYIVAAGSTHYSGDRYETKGSLSEPFAHLPQALLDAILAEQEKYKDVSLGELNADGTHKPEYCSPRYAQIALERECEIISATSEGSRHEALISSAGSIGRFLPDGLLDRNEVSDAYRAAIGKWVGGDINVAKAMKDVRDGLRYGATNSNVLREDSNVGISVKGAQLLKKITITKTNVNGKTVITKVAKEKPFSKSLGELSTLPPQWLVKHWITANSLGVLAGPSGSGKTFLALSLLFHIAAKQKEWLGFRCKKFGWCLYVCGEGESGIANRCETFAKDLGIPRADIPIEVTMAPVGVLNDVDVGIFESELRLLVEKYGEPPAIICFDTLARNFGDGNENETRDMSRFVDTVDRWRREFTTTVLIVHHTAKDKMTWDQARGSGALFAGVDFEIIIKPGAMNVLGHNTFVIRNSKMKNDKTSADLSCALVPKINDYDEDGDGYGGCLILPELTEGRDEAIRLGEKAFKIAHYAREQYIDVVIDRGQQNPLYLSEEALLKGAGLTQKMVDARDPNKARDFKSLMNKKLLRLHKNGLYEVLEKILYIKEI